MKKLFTLLGSLSLTLAASAQNTVLLQDTALYVGSVSGNPVSIVATNSGGGTFGLSVNSGAGFMLAEDFIIPASESWRMDSLITYAYQTNSSASGTPVNTLTTAVVQVYNNTPGAGGVVIGGDTITNQIRTSTWSGMYRVSKTDLNSKTRAIMRVAASVPATSPAILTAGTYWIAWGMKGSLPSGPFCVPKTLTDTTLALNQNARQLASGAWGPSMDGTIPNGVSFILKGSKNPLAVSQTAHAGFQLGVPYPSPCKAGKAAAVSFSLATPQPVELVLLNTTGQKVAVLAKDHFGAGDYLVQIPGESLAAGVYFLRLQAGTFLQTQRFLIE